MGGSSSSASTQVSKEFNFVTTDNRMAEAGAGIEGNKTVNIGEIGKHGQAPIAAEGGRSTAVRTGRNATVSIVETDAGTVEAGRDIALQALDKGFTFGQSALESNEEVQRMASNVIRDTVSKTASIIQEEATDTQQDLVRSFIVLTGILVAGGAAAFIYRKGV